MEENLIISLVKKQVLYIPKTISLSVPDTDNTFAMLRIHYAGMVPSQMNVLENTAKLSILSRPADTYRLIKEYHSMQEWQQMISEAGWYFGAGYMYRWRHAPHSLPHLFGLEVYEFIGGDTTAVGDADTDLNDLATKHGCWEWEVNSAWLRLDKLPEWADEDPVRGKDGCRNIPFPGWAGEHPILRDVEMGYESHYYFYKPEKYDKETSVLVKSPHAQEK